jgi:hypothetical protein
MLTIELLFAKQDVRYKITVTKNVKVRLSFVFMSFEHHIPYTIVMPTKSLIHFTSFSKMICGWL